MANGNMYSFITNNWNPVKGKCAHGCRYCYMKKFPDLGELRFDEKVFKSPMGNGCIFVCSGTDLFQDSVPFRWIAQTLAKLSTYPQAKFLLQTKNPERFFDFIDFIESHMILCTTAETDIDSEVSSAPCVSARIAAMKTIKKYFPQFTTMISVEPVINFSCEFYKDLINAKPDIITIGANSRGDIKLLEPTEEMIHNLIVNLSENLDDTQIILKKNLSRIYIQRESLGHNVVDESRDKPGGSALPFTGQ